MSRTTVEIDDEALRRAKQALGLTRTKDTIDAALRRVADDVDAAAQERAERQRRALTALPAHADMAVLTGGSMWR